MNEVEPLRDFETVVNLIDGIQSPRNKLLLAVGFFTGLRISDILNLKIEDLKGSEITITEQKTKNTKKGKPIPKLITIELKEYINESLNKWGRYKNDNEYAFISQKSINKPMSRQHADRIVKYECKKAGIKEKVGTHTLRKTAGTLIYKFEKDVEKCRLYLGHSNTKDTIRYLGLDKTERDNIAVSLSKFIVGARKK